MLQELLLVGTFSGIRGIEFIPFFIYSLYIEESQNDIR